MENASMADSPSTPVLDPGQSPSDGDVSSVATAWRLQWMRLGVLLLLAVTVATAYLTRHCLAVANTRMQVDLGFNNEQFGYLYSAFSLGYLICQVPGGWLGQRLGTRVTIPLLCCVWSVMTLATGLVSSLPALIAARFGYGLAQAGLIPNQAQVLKDWFPETSRGSASAAIVTAMSVGGFAALSLTSVLLGYVHWRTLLFGYSIIGIVWSAIFFVAFRSQPHHIPWLRVDPPVPPTFPASTPVDVTEQASRSNSRWSALWGMLNRFSFWALLIQMIFKAAGYNLLVTFLPTYLELSQSISPDRAAELSSWSLVTVVVGSLCGGWVVDQLQRLTGSKHISRVGVGCVSLLLTAFIMGVATYGTTGRQIAIMIAVSSFLMGVAGPCAWAAIIDVGGKNSAVVMGFLNMGGALAGIVISPLVGRLMDHIKATGGNWNLVIHVHVLFYLIAAISWLFVSLERTPQSLEATDVI